MLVIAALAITLIAYEARVFLRGEENRFHSATMTVHVGSKQHRFVYSDPLVFFDQLLKTQTARERDFEVVIQETEFSGSTISRIQCEIQAHSDNVEVDLDREELAAMERCRCAQRDQLTYLKKLVTALGLVGEAVGLQSAPKIKTPDSAHAESTL